ncbi:MAG TPA: hypothetical protein VE780_05095 [Thermoleophilaceae bacterium]|nr:hypothetical protein [Thermoleophilaceae bacterium]
MTTSAWVPMGWIACARSGQCATDASPELSRRVGPGVPYLLLSEISYQQRR